MATTDNVFPRVDFQIDLEQNNDLAHTRQISTWYPGLNTANNLNKKHQSVFSLYGNEARYYQRLLDQDKANSPKLFIPITQIGSEIFNCEDGRRDRSFNKNGNDEGINAVNYSGESTVINDLAIQGDDKIVVAGQVVAGVGTNFLVIRYNFDGTLDETFANGAGFLSFAAPASTSNTFAAVKIQKDQKIIASGSSIASGSTAMTTARLNPDGSFDTSFGTNGILVTDFFPAAPDNVNDLMIRPNGNIILAGDAVSGVSDVGIVEYFPDGTGVTLGFHALGGTASHAFGIAPQINNAPVVVGSYDPGGGDNWLVLRTQANDVSVLDTTFNGTGFQNFAVNAAGDEQAWSVAIQSDDKIVAAGYSNNGAAQEAVIARLDPNGGLDATFGTGGIVRFAVGTNQQFRDVQIQLDGKIIVSGFLELNGVQAALVARYNTNGTLDTSYHGTGYNFNTKGSSALWGGVALQSSDQKAVTAGWFFNPYNSTASSLVGRYC